MKLVKGVRYQAGISLGFFEKMASNSTIADKLAEAGFSDVLVTGSGSSRSASATWSLETQDAEIPSQIKSVSSLT